MDATKIGNEWWHYYPVNVNNVEVQETITIGQGKN